jgi:hypothetical protein
MRLFSTGVAVNRSRNRFFERVDQLPVEGIAVFKMMGLIDDHHVIFPAGHGIDIALGFSLIDGGQNKRQVPEALDWTCENPDRRWMKNQGEFGFQFFLPLADQWCRGSGPGHF